MTLRRTDAASEGGSKDGEAASRVVDRRGCNEHLTSAINNLIISDEMIKYRANAKMRFMRVF